jgi:hypothetical protein
MLARPSPSLVVSSLALAVALGGTAYAAGVLPANSVGTAQLRNGAVVAAKVKPRSLVASNFRAGQLPAGPKGPVGLPGPAGPAGAAATKLWAVVSSSGAVVRSSGNVNVQKPAGPPGRYTVTFPQDVGNCASIVTVSGTGGTPETGTAAAANGSSSAQVAVQTTDPGGSAANKTFAVAVFC